MATMTAPAIAISPRIDERLRRGELSAQQVAGFRAFLQEVDRDLLHHRIITDNRYTRWFQQGNVPDEDLRHFIQQFSVFSNQFMVAALLRVVNAPTLLQMRAAKEILLNELGVIYRAAADGRESGQAALSEADKDRWGDPDLVGTEGTVDGGLYRHRAAHFEWLLGVGADLGLDYTQLGKRHQGRPYTLHFCDELQRLYGSPDGQIAEGASFAVENWAAAGFWQELVDGLSRIKAERHPHLRLSFFTWHNRVEATHAGHTLEELEEVYFNPEFDRDRFFQGASEVLDAIACFWDGLDADRLEQFSKAAFQHFTPSVWAVGR